MTFSRTDSLSKKHSDRNYQHGCWSLCQWSHFKRLTHGSRVQAGTGRYKSIFPFLAGTFLCHVPRPTRSFLTPSSLNDCCGLSTESGFCGHTARFLPFLIDEVDRSINHILLSYSLTTIPHMFCRPGLHNDSPYRYALPSTCHDATGGSVSPSKACRPLVRPVSRSQLVPFGSLPLGCEHDQIPLDYATGTL